MKNEKVHVVMLLDRSGSMASIASDVIGGWNQYLRDQQGLDKPATLSLVQFDGVDPQEVIYHFKPLHEVQPLSEATFQPRGNTPLLDALGECITETAMDLASCSEEARPAHVVFVVITDGQENASQRYTRAHVQRLMERMTKGGWEFVFLSSDLSATTDAHSYGFSSANTASFGKSGASMRQAMDVLSYKTRRRRLNWDSANMAFTADERLHMMHPELNKEALNLLNPSKEDGERQD